jgi:hypothetical protein
MGGEMMRKIVPFARDGVAVFAALVGFTVLAAPGQAQGVPPGPPTQSVNVVNPPTNPVNTTVRNPATMPVFTSSVNEPGLAPYQETQTQTGGGSGFQYRPVGEEACFKGSELSGIC